MKEPFRHTINAPNAELAFKQVGPKYSKTIFRMVADKPHAVRAVVEAKLKRVEENPAIYADKIDEYRGILRRFDQNPDKDDALITAIIEHGDLRVDNAAGCAIRQRGPATWVVFGYDFGTN